MKMIIAIAMNVSDHSALKKTYFVYEDLENLRGYSKGTQFFIFNLKE